MMNKKPVEVVFEGHAINSKKKPVDIVLTVLQDAQYVENLKLMWAIIIEMGADIAKEIRAVEEIGKTSKS